MRSPTESTKQQILAEWCWWEVWLHEGKADGLSEWMSSIPLTPIWQTSLQLELFLCWLTDCLMRFHLCRDLKFSAPSFPLRPDGDVFKIHNAQKREFLVMIKAVWSDSVWNGSLSRADVTALTWILSFLLLTNHCTHANLKLPLMGCKALYSHTKPLNLERLGKKRKTWCYWVIDWFIITIEVLLNGGCVINLTCSLNSPPACCIRVSHSTTHSRLSTFKDFCFIVFLSISGLTVFIHESFCFFCFFLDPPRSDPQHRSPLSAPKLRNLLVSFQFSWSISLDSSPLSKPLNLINLDCGCSLFSPLVHLLQLLALIFF